MKYLATAPQYMYHWYKRKGLIPDNPAGFTPKQTVPLPGRESAGPMRVLIDNRKGTRKLLNHDELVDECNEDSGPWECRGWSFGNDLMK